MRLLRRAASALAALGWLGCGGDAAEPGATQPETCRICAAPRYTCGWSRGESFDMEVSEVTAEGCRGAYSTVPAAPLFTFECEPPRVCDARGSCADLQVEERVTSWTSEAGTYQCYPP